MGNVNSEVLYRNLIFNFWESIQLNMVKKLLCIRTLGDEFSNQILSRMNDDQKESALNKKIQQLTKDLEYAKLKIISLETMITVAENDLKIKIRKKRGTKQLKE